MLIRTLVTFIVRLFNLVEAEAKSAKQHVVRLGLSLALIWAAVLMLVCGAGVFMAAIAVALAEVMHTGWALAIVGAILLAVAIAFGLVAKSVFSKKAQS